MGTDLGTFTDNLAVKADRVARIDRVARRGECRGFMTLLCMRDIPWERLGRSMTDYLLGHFAHDDPGVTWQTASRMFAVQPLDGELRYYAGELPQVGETSASMPATEWGILATARDAVDFAEAYLCEGTALADLAVERTRLGPDRRGQTSGP